MVPTHGWRCNTTTWPTKCPRCREPVFFFSCSCGSRVFFDELGDPWPIHDCDTSWTRSFVRFRDDRGAITVEIGEGLTISRPPDGFSVDDSLIQRARRSRQQPQRDPIEAVLPQRHGEVRSIVGILRELDKRANLRSSLDLPDTGITGAFLGPISGQRAGRVTIHTPPQQEGAPIGSYTAWVPSDLLNVPHNTRGVMVSAELSALIIPGRHAIWFCAHYDVLE